MADIKAAAERVRRVRACHPRHHVYPWWSATSTYDDDCERLADAYLAELDDTPIDEEWAAAIRNPLYDVGRGHGHGKWLMRTLSPAPVMVAEVTTRGQVRSLLRAMGVKP